MSLILTIESYQNQAAAQAESRHVGQQQFAIGRAANNDWALDDPEMVLSRKHCVVTYDNGRYFLHDTSVNGVFINHSAKPLGKNNRVELNHGDTISLGDYTLRVDLAAEAGANTNDSAPPAVDMFDDLLGSDPLPPDRSSAPTDADPFADLAGDSQPAPSTPPTDTIGIGNDQRAAWQQLSEADHLPAEQVYYQPPEARPETSPDAARPDAARPNAARPNAARPDAARPDAARPDAARPDAARPDAARPDAARPDAARPDAASPADAAAGDMIGDLDDDSLIQKIARPQLDAVMPPPMRSEGPPTPAVTEDDSVAGDDAPSPAGADADDPLALDQPPAAQPVAEPPSAEPSRPAAEPLQKLPETAADERPASAPAPVGEFTDLIPKVKIPTTAPTPTATPPPDRQTPAGDGQLDEAVAALLNGAGVKLDLSPDQALELMHNVGVMLRSTAQGITEVLRARQQIRNEFHIEQTMLGATDNNPFKALPVDEILPVLLGRGNRTWMAPVKAIHESLRDIKMHELAVIAGMQGAVKQLFDTLDPEEFEQQAQLLSSGWFGPNKAKYWDAYKAHYAKLSEAVDDDFQRLFEGEFSRAYEAQQRRAKGRD